MSKDSELNDIQGKRRDARFYVCLAMAFCLCVMGFFAPPKGEIAESILYCSITFLCAGALAIGVDLKGCIHELNVLIHSKKQ